MKRRDFLKATVLALAPLIVPVPVRLFVPPRDPYVDPGLRGLDGLYKHLGVVPPTTQLNIGEGKIIEMEDWDGKGYPCLLESVCTYGSEPPRVWIYDFDLYNFRHLMDAVHRPDQAGWPSFALYAACVRFGSDSRAILEAGGGWLSEQARRYGVFGSAIYAESIGRSEIR